MEIKRAVLVVNRYGLHARASTRLAQLAKEFQSSILISAAEDDDEEEEVDAKSILAVLTLGVAKGQELQLRVVGEDAEDAMTAIVELFERKFDEE